MKLFFHRIIMRLSSPQTSPASPNNTHSSSTSSSTAALSSSLTSHSSSSYYHHHNHNQYRNRGVVRPGNSCLQMVGQQAEYLWNYAMTYLPVSSRDYHHMHIKSANSSSPHRRISAKQHHHSYHPQHYHHLESFSSDENCPHPNCQQNHLHHYHHHINQQKQQNTNNISQEHHHHHHQNSLENDDGHSVEEEMSLFQADQQQQASENSGGERGGGPYNGKEGGGKGGRFRRHSNCSIAMSGGSSNYKLSPLSYHQHHDSCPSPDHPLLLPPPNHDTSEGSDSKFSSSKRSSRRHFSSSKNSNKHCPQPPPPYHHAADFYSHRKLHHLSQHHSQEHLYLPPHRHYKQQRRRRCSKCTVLLVLFFLLLFLVYNTFQNLRSYWSNLKPLSEFHYPMDIDFHQLLITLREEENSFLYSLSGSSANYKAQRWRQKLTPTNSNAYSKISHNNNNNMNITKNQPQQSQQQHKKKRDNEASNRRKSPKQINPANFSTLISPNSMLTAYCKSAFPTQSSQQQHAQQQQFDLSEPPHILLLVKSRISEFLRRREIRATWGLHNCQNRSVAASSRHSSSSTTTSPLLHWHTWQVLFLFGTTPDTELSRGIHHEAQRFGDVVQFDFVDNYANNTYKVMRGLSWARESGCTRRYSFVLLVDDDYFVNPWNLRHLLQIASPSSSSFSASSSVSSPTSPPVKPSFSASSSSSSSSSQNDATTNEFRITPELYPRLVAGSVWYNAVPRRDPSQKWFVTKENYPYENYPPYPAGGFVIMSAPMADTLSLLMPYLLYSPFDDVMLGIVLFKLYLQPVNLKRVFHDRFEAAFKHYPLLHQQQLEQQQSVKGIASQPAKSAAWHYKSSVRRPSPANQNRQNSQSKQSQHTQQPQKPHSQQSSMEWSNWVKMRCGSLCLIGSKMPLNVDRKPFVRPETVASHEFGQPGALFSQWQFFQLARNCLR